MDYDAIAAELTRLRAELRQREARMQAHIAHVQGPVSADFEEQAVERANDEVVQSLQTQVVDEIAAIDLALKRISLGTYGHCARCGETINAQRLKALPHVGTCAQCAT